MSTNRFVQRFILIVVLHRLRPIFFAFALVAVACGLRWPGLGKIVWNLDEGSTFTMAEVVRHGGVMYRDAADNRTPLVPYAKALILSAVGDWNIRGAHIVVSAMLGLTAIWLWRLGKKAGDEKAGAAGAVFFTLISFIMLGAVDAMAAHTGWFLIFFSALGMWAFVAAQARGSGGLAAAAGVAFALAALSKQPGVLDWGVCLVLCGLLAWTTPTRRGEAAKLAAMLTLGFAAPLVGTYWYFSAHGAWKDFLQYSWYYNTLLYVPEVPFRERLLAVRTPLLLARENTPFVFGLAVVAAGWLLTEVGVDLIRKQRKFRVLPWLILGWTASGLVSTVLSGRNFAHYSIQVLPGLSLACGWVMARLWEKTAAWRLTDGPAWHSPVVRLILGLGCVNLIASAGHRAATFDLSDGISKDIGLVIKARTRPDDRIFVWGYEPELHVFSERLPNTRFIYSVFLTGLIPWTNLDALKNTDYAIIPGAWDALWVDFARRPPAVIVDTHGNRGFLKYPLRKQAKLWALVEKDYVEVAVDYAKARGYSVYQRATPVSESDSRKEEMREDSSLNLTVPERTAPITVSVSVGVPAGVTAVDLVLDGRPYRRIENADGPAGQVSFFVLASDLSLGEHRVQAILRGMPDRGSRVHRFTVEPASEIANHFDGPPLTFAGRTILPVESEAIDGHPVALRPDTDQWDAHAPSRLVYPRPDGLTQLDFTFGMRPGSYDGSNPQKTDGVDVSVFFEEDGSPPKSIYRRHVDPVGNASDRTPMSGHATLPGFAGGRIIFMITPGPMNIPAFDWAYWTHIDGDSPPLKLKFRGQPVLPVELDAKLGVTPMDFHQWKVLLLHAPAHFAFRDVPGMTELSGEFGMLDETWQGPQQSNGAVFAVEQVLKDGTKHELFSRALYPANKPGDRGLQSFKVALPYAEGSLIRLETRPADPRNNSFNYTFWRGLSIAEFPAQLAFEGQVLTSVRSEAVNGFNYMDEGGRRVLFAHPPSEIVFKGEPGARRVKGTMGLIPGAYTGQGNTDGAVFVVVAENAAGVRTELFRRHLNPRDQAQDRGAVPFDVALPDLVGGHLILRTETAPSGRLDFAWSFWGGLELGR